jgi:16S rRNA (uracil1498-N3)-methyltransferase
VADPRIFTDQEIAKGQTLQLEVGASRHLAGALRLQAGAPIVLFNGTGGEYPERISAVERKRVIAEILEHNDQERESSLGVELGIAVSRGERMDWVVQKATELGVRAIHPLNSERTEVRLKGERAEKKYRHWRNIAISACEQCGRNQLPRISSLQPLADWCKQVQSPHKLVLHHRGSGSLNLPGQPEKVALLIGPEGGLSPAEIELAEQSGFIALTLGPRVMRTETAPLAALAILQHRYGDMN